MRPPCVVRRGASASRGHSAGLQQAAATRGASASRGRSAAHADHRTRGASALAGVPRPMRAAVHAGHRPSKAFRRPPAGRRHARDIGPSRASRRPPPHAGHRPSKAFRRPPAVRRRTRGRGLSRAFRDPCGPPHVAGPRPPAGVPRPMQAFTTRGASALAAHAALAGVSQAARARPHLPAARFSRKPPCGIGSRMVYCT